MYSTALTINNWGLKIFAVNSATHCRGHIYSASPPHTHTTYVHTRTHTQYTQALTLHTQSPIVLCNSMIISLPLSLSLSHQYCSTSYLQLLLTTPKCSPNWMASGMLITCSSPLPLSPPPFSFPASLLPPHSFSAHLEEVSKTPVSHHLKERVMINIFPNIIKIIVLPSCTNALLRIDNALQSPKVTIGIHGALEDRLELQREWTQNDGY